MCSGVCASTRQERAYPQRTVSCLRILRTAEGNADEE